MKTSWIGLGGAIILGGIILLTTCGLKHQETTETEKTEKIAHQVWMPPVPDSIRFVGELVPMDRFEVRESLERELLVNTYFHSQTIRLIKLAPRFFTIIDPILKAEGVPSDFRYLAVAESSLNPKAVSPAGAAGLWQFMRGTAADYGLEVNSEIDERYHIEKSTRAACRYLKNSFRKYGNWGLVAASYNAGPGSVEKQMARQKVNNYFDLLMADETERYVFRILAFKIIMEEPEKYGFVISDTEKYPLWNTRKVEFNGPIADFTNFAIGYGITYKTLKYYNPWLREASLTNKTDKTYAVEIPVVK